MATQTITKSTSSPMVIGGNSEAPLENTELLIYDEIIKRQTAIIRFGWHELGEAATTIKTRQLWKQYAAPSGEEPFHSFDDYVMRRAGKSRTVIYRDVQLYTTLGKDVGEANCRAMTQANAIWLQRLAKRIGEKKAFTQKVIDAALAMPEKAFSEHCNNLLPGAAKEEQKHNITFSSCDLSLAQIVDEAVQVAMWESELDDKREALERIAVYFLDGKCEREGATKLSNRQAYHKAAGRKRPQ